MMPEFPIEKLNKEELLKLIKMQQERLFLPGENVRELAFRVREETLFEEYSASVDACSAASARVQEVPSKQAAQLYEALAVSARMGEKAERAYAKYKAFTKQREKSCAP